MNKTNIEWVTNPDGTRGVTCNSKTGCLNHVNGMCKGGGFPCYAYRLANGRLKERYLANKNLAPFASELFTGRASQMVIQGCFNDPFYPRWWPERLEQIRKHKKPSGIFLDDMSDWMGDYWPEEWTQQELQIMRDCPQHRFYTLTKQPQNLPKWSPFPDNCWVGVTATNQQQYWSALTGLAKVDCKVFYISFEPLLEQIIVGDAIKYSWPIIGACTGTEEEVEKLQNKYQSLSVVPYGGRWTARPEEIWVTEIIEACKKAGISYFLKDNLRPLMGNDLVQDMPIGVAIDH